MDFTRHSGLLGIRTRKTEQKVVAFDHDIKMAEITRLHSKAKESVFSRAYFHFKTMEAVIAFHQGYDGHVFVDSRGQ